MEIHSYTLVHAYRLFQIWDFHDDERISIEHVGLMKRCNAENGVDSLLQGGSEFIVLKRGAGIFLQLSQTIKWSDEKAELRIGTKELIFVEKLFVSRD